MLWFVWLVIAGIVVVGILLVVRRARPPAAPKQSPLLERTVFDLQLGDIVQYFETDWVVEGWLTYRQDGFSWCEYLLQGGERIRWLSVEEDDVVRVAWLAPTKALSFEREPPPTLQFDSETYQRTDSGTADMEREGNVRQHHAEQCRFFDYEGSNDKVLSIEEWDGQYEVTVGRCIHPSHLTLLPGSGERVYRN